MAKNIGMLSSPWFADSTPLNGTNQDSKLRAISDLTMGKGFTIDKPTSYRRVEHQQNRDAAGRYAKGYHDISEAIISDKSGEYSTRKERNYGVESTAIDHARYDPSDGSLNIAYNSNPDKEYKFKADEADVVDWMNAPSKGRLTQAWRSSHRYPGY